MFRRLICRFDDLLARQDGRSGSNAVSEPGVRPAGSLIDVSTKTNPVWRTAASIADANQLTRRPSKISVPNSNNHTGKGWQMPINVISTSGKGDPVKIEAIFSQYELQNFTYEFDDDGDFDLTYLEDEIEDEDEIADEREAEQQPVEEADQNKEVGEYFIRDFPMAFRRDVPVAQKDRMREGALGFYRLLQDLAMVIEKQILILVTGFDDERESCGAELFSVVPGSRSVNYLWNEIDRNPFIGGLLERRGEWISQAGENELNDAESADERQ
jgi:hypothetical protein